MNFEQVKTTLSQTKGDIVVVGLFKGEDPGKVLKTLDGKLATALQEAAKQHLENEGFKGKASEVVSVPTFGHMTASRM
ncbi:MAG: hypothetical protein SGJ27_23495, partial [Candidatus Melainabacteria bacterium]|nr:hypothetical protein [Candidatus Melainabacteria bacterium]